MNYKELFRDFCENKCLLYHYDCEICSAKEFIKHLNNIYFIGED
jgi:hypothetical protein